MELKFKKTLIILLSVIFLTAVSAESSFNGFAGLTLDANLEAVYANGVIAGQYAFNDSLSIKGNFQFSTDDIIQYGLFQETPSAFSINELSATYTYYGENSLLHFSALLGDQSAFGSDSFVKQYLGTRNFASSLMTPLSAPVSSSINSFSGLGLSFVDDFGSNALGVYAFYNRSKPKDNAQVNGDLQYAFQVGTTVIDSTLGVTVPIEGTTSTGEKVFILVKQVNLRAGISTLFSISDRMKLFFQAGISDINLPNLNPVKLDKLYLFVEPRIALPVCSLNISFFCLSDPALSNLAFITKPLGCNLNVQTLPFFVFNHTAYAGIDIAAASSRNPDAAQKEIEVAAAPYFDYALSAGSLHMAVTAHPLWYDDVSKFIKFSFSYKAQF